MAPAFRPLRPHNNLANVIAKPVFTVASVTNACLESGDLSSLQLGRVLVSFGTSRNYCCDLKPFSTILIRFASIGKRFNSPQCCIVSHSFILTISSLQLGHVLVRFGTSRNYCCDLKPFSKILIRFASIGKRFNSPPC